MKRIIMLLLVTCQLMLVAVANDGSSLWLPREHNAQPSTFVKGSKGMALEELRNYYRGEVTVRLKLNRKARSGDAYSIQVTPERITLSSGTSSGLLYAAYDLLRMQQLGDIHSVESRPRLSLRLLNHWDNLDGSVERGYAGKSIWKWDEMQVIGKNPARENTFSKIPCLFIRVAVQDITHLIVNGRPPGFRDDPVDNRGQIAVSEKQSPAFPDHIIVKMRKDKIRQISAGDIKNIIKLRIPETVSQQLCFFSRRSRSFIEKTADHFGYQAFRQQFFFQYMDFLYTFRRKRVGTGDKGCFFHHVHTSPPFFHFLTFYQPAQYRVKILWKEVLLT